MNGRRRRRVSSPSPRLVLTTEQAARRLGVSELTVRRRIKAGAVRAVRIGGTLRIPMDGDGLASLPTECTVRQVANSMGVSELTVRRWIKSGELPAAKRGRTWSVLRRDLAALLLGEAAAQVDGSPGAERVAR